MRKMAVVLFALLWISMLSACSDTLEPDPALGDQVPAEDSEIPEEAATPSAEQRGTTAIFSWGDLRIEVSNVRDILQKDMVDDGGAHCDYRVFVCFPESEAVVLQADMNDAAGYADGLSHAQWGFIEQTTDERLEITDGMEGQPVGVADMRGVASLESSLFVLMFEIRDTPAEPSGMPYDINGDGSVQTWEFPVPTGEAMGLTGEDAALYTAAAKATAERLIPNGSGSDTMLMLTYVNVFGEYGGENGETHYVCGLGEQFYYDLGKGLDDPRSPQYSGFGGGGGLACITVAADGTLLDIQETYDGADNRERIRELCGPLTELADAINSGGDAPVRQLVPTGDALLRIYLDHYFAE